MNVPKTQHLASALRAHWQSATRVGTFIVWGFAALCLVGGGTTQAPAVQPAQTVEPTPLLMYRPWHPSPPPLEHGGLIRVKAPKSCAWSFLPAQFLKVYRMASPFDGWLPLFTYAMKRAPGFSPSDCASLGMGERCASVEELTERLRQRCGEIYDIDDLTSDCLEEYGLEPCYVNNALSRLTIGTYEPWPPDPQRKPLLDPRPISYLDFSYDSEGRVVEIRSYNHSGYLKRYHMVLASRTVICYSATGKIQSIYELMPEECDY